MAAKYSTQTLNTPPYDYDRTMSDPLLEIERTIQRIKGETVPTTTDMIELGGLLDNYEKTAHSMKKNANIKNKAQTAVVHFNSFPALHSCEEMLPLYTFVGKYSETLGLTGVFDMLEKKEYFRNSFKFHVLWAEAHAKKGHGQRFREIMELAQKRLEESSDMIEAEFKTLAQQHLPDSNIFPDMPTRKDRRRSQLDVLQKFADRFKTAKRLTSEKNVQFMLKHEFVDKKGYEPVSLEEYLYAQWLDDQDQAREEADMDISMADATFQTSPKIAEPVHIPAAVKTTESRYTENEPKLAPVLEMSEEPEMSFEKKRRIFSPEQPTRGSRFSNPSTYTAESPVSYRESQYHKADAVFCDTVNLGPAASKDVTIPVTAQPVEAFEVYEDAESVAPIVQPLTERRPFSQLNLVEPKEKSPLKETNEKANTVSPLINLDVSEIENVNESPYNFDDDPTLAGQQYGLTGETKPTSGIVTSTPAPGLMGFGQNITPDDFFSVPIEENYGFMKRRQSLAPKTDFRAPVQRHVTPPPKETTISTALAQMTVKSPPIEEEPEEENVLERTGINKPRESISTQSINPWDRSIREKIMKRAKTPLVQHNFESASPKISRNKELVIGGMKFYVIDLVGEGGFAKVFKCIDEETKKTVALKYEVPSCAWEVYICDQLRHRLRQSVTPSAKRSFNCVMEITDAFIFKNSSILINEFLPHRTLLDLSNKLHGSANSQLILLLSIHIATIIRDVQACQMIHGDIKPDNIMILRSIDENWDIEELLTTPLLKFIDWGRAIDMAAFETTTSFKGRAGTACFDCPEMMLDKPWNYQTDYFGFVATMHVFVFGKYCKLLTVGRNTMDSSLKRRLACRDVMTTIFDRLLNIPSCQELPNWNEVIADMTNVFRQEFSASEWRASARTFNQCLPDDK